MTTVAFVTDLMDRSRITAAVPDIVFVGRADAAAGADTVIVDLARFATDLAAIRASTSGRIVAFGAHVDDALLATAGDDGADLVLPRSRFFRDPAAALAGDPDSAPDPPSALGEALGGELAE